MSAESKASIRERILKGIQPRTIGVPYDPAYGLPGFPGPQQLPGKAGPSEPGLVVQVAQVLPIRQVFQKEKTDWLYAVKQIIEEILASRPDAKR